MSSDIPFYKLSNFPARDRTYFKARKALEINQTCFCRTTVNVQKYNQNRPFRPGTLEQAGRSLVLLKFIEASRNFGQSFRRVVLYSVVYPLQREEIEYVTFM